MSTENTQQQNAAMAKTEKADAQQIEGELSDDDLFLVSGGRTTQNTSFGSMVRTGTATGTATKLQSPTAQEQIAN
jgi:hypothetical protein